MSRFWIVSTGTSAMALSCFRSLAPNTTTSTSATATSTHTSARPFRQRMFTASSFPSARGSQRLSHQRLELRLGDALVVAGADQCLPRLRELGLGRQDVEERRASH